MAAVQLAKAPVPIGKPRTVAEMPWPAGGNATTPATASSAPSSTPAAIKK
jgi:hypothetical protein